MSLGRGLRWFTLVVLVMIPLRTLLAQPMASSGVSESFWVKRDNSKPSGAHAGKNASGKASNKGHLRGH